MMNKNALLVCFGLFAVPMGVAHAGKPKAPPQRNQTPNNRLAAKWIEFTGKSGIRFQKFQKDSGGQDYHAFLKANVLAAESVVNLHERGIAIAEAQRELALYEATLPSKR